MLQTKPEILLRALEREKNARKQAEKILEEKSKELYHITQQLRQANAKLKTGLNEKTTELQGVFDNLVDAYVLINVRGDIIKWNDAAQELFGYTTSEKINVNQLIYKEDLSYALKSFNSLLNKGMFSDYIARVNTANKGVRWVHINASVIKNEHQKVIGAQGIVKDITLQRTIEAENKKLLLDLENSNEELEEYAHIVSHDLKSPLRSINALVNWLKEDYGDKLGKDGIQNISLIEQTLEKMEQLINGILDYSSISNKKGVSIEQVNTQKIIEEIKNTIYVPKHIEIVVKKDLPIISASKTRMLQLFQNIISNAVNHIDKEKGLVEISANSNATHHIFEIKDNGVGIEKSNFEKIFKIFQSFSDNQNSTGIGLSIVKKIVESHEGKIWLESKPKIGTTFFFTLKKE